MVANNITERPTSWTALSSSPGTAAADMPLHADGVLSLLAFARTTAVRTVFGPVPLKHALDWPVAASYDELAGCAAWMGGRIPTADEVRSAHAHAADERRRRDDAQGKLDRMVPAVNGHLLHDGVEVTPPTSPASPAGTDKRAAGREGPFVPLAGANVGFAHWHPVPVTAAGGAVGARAEMGGVWEWTSTVLARHEGYKPMALYPGYSGEFVRGGGGADEDELG
jgi:formylglycine-generating enzyme required for sulfatase activity